MLALDEDLTLNITPAADPGRRIVLVICLYQLLGDQLYGWWLGLPIW